MPLDPTDSTPLLASDPPRYDMSSVGPDLVRAAETMYAEVQRAIEEGRLDARNPIADAALDYREAREDLRTLTPPPPEPEYERFDPTVAKPARGERIELYLIASNEGWEWIRGEVLSDPHEPLRMRWLDGVEQTFRDHSDHRGRRPVDA